MKKKDLMNARFERNQHFIKDGYAFSSPLENVSVFTKKINLVNENEWNLVNSGSIFLNCIYKGRDDFKFTYSFTKEQIGIDADKSFFGMPKISFEYEKHYVYLIKSEDKYKIGITKYPVNRPRNIGTKAPSPCLTIRLIPMESRTVKGTEDALHRLFTNRHSNGEWFSLTEFDIKMFDLYTCLINKEYVNNFYWRDTLYVNNMSESKKMDIYNSVFINDKKITSNTIWEYVKMEDLRVFEKSIEYKIFFNGLSITGSSSPIRMNDYDIPF